MKYKDEQIDDILACYYRVGAKTYVVNKYNISPITLTKYLNNPKFSKANVNKRISTKQKIARFREILCFYEKNGRELTIKKFNMKAEIFDKQLLEMLRVVFYNGFEYKKKMSEIQQYRDQLVKANSLYSDSFIDGLIEKANWYLMVTK